MAAILTSLRNTIIAGIVLTVIMVLYVMNSTGEALAFVVPTFDHEYFTFFMRWLHVLCGVMWIGLLWYLNFIQIPNMPNIPDEQKPAIGKVIAPAVLFWFRWGAMGTLVTGLLLAWMSGYLMQAISLGLLEDGTEKSTAIGIGMWLGFIMFVNVWLVIWPNQQRALGLVEADAATKAASARTAMLFSRTNTLLSIPMLYAMVSAQNLY
jgi:uncharacterized membrane protein